jgi:hypothetical protein
MNAIAEAIRTHGQVDYLDPEKNPLQAQWLRIVDLQAACRLLVAMGDADIQDLPLNGVGAVAKLIAQELDAIGRNLDTANAEICQAVNGGDLFLAKETQP